MTDGDVLSILTCIIEHVFSANARHKIIDYVRMLALEHQCSSIGERGEPMTRKTMSGATTEANKDLN